MVDNRCAKWKEDENLRKAMKEYVKQGLKREKALDFLRRDFPQYTWSVRSLDRRLRHFNINYNDKNVDFEQVKHAIEEELKGPGKLLDYRAMHKKVRQKYDLFVTCDKVYDMLYTLDPEGVESRGGIGAKRKRQKGNFSSNGPNWDHSLDGHDKLMGYQNSTFPIAIYGCLDTASRKLLWLRVWTSNSNPLMIGRWYVEHLLETCVMSAMMRLDRGTETGTMALFTHICAASTWMQMQLIQLIQFCMALLHLIK